MKVNVCCQFDPLSFESLLLSDGNIHEFSDHEMQKIERKMTQRAIIQHKKLRILVIFLHPRNCSYFTILKEKYKM